MEITLDILDIKLNKLVLNLSLFSILLPVSAKENLDYTLCENFHLTGLDNKVAVKFIEGVKQNLIKKQIIQLSEKVRYPIQFKSAKKKVTIKDKKSFITNFSKFINKDWRLKVIFSKRENSICNSDGIGTKPRSNLDICGKLSYKSKCS